MGGELEVQPGLREGTLLRLRVPLRVADTAVAPAFVAALATTAAAGTPTQEASNALATPPLKRRATNDARDSDLAELQLTSRMFECLMTNSDDVFAICSIRKLQGEEAAAAAAAGRAAIAVRIDYISPSVAWRMAFSQADAVGRDIVNMCHPEDCQAFLEAVQAAHEGTSSRGQRLTHVHRGVTADGGTIWCNTSGLCKGDQLFLVCRDMRTIRSVELALRTFTLAISHDMREPCNAILVAVAVLERRACVAAAAAEPTAHNGASSPPMDAQALVACIRSACSLLLGIVGNVLTGACIWLFCLPTLRADADALRPACAAPQVEAGELTLQRAVFSPARLVADVMQACRLGCAAVAAAAGGTGIELDTACGAGGEPLPALVEADRNRIAQVLQNLVRAAFRRLLHASA
jgi:hypothetical protein